MRKSAIALTCVLYALGLLVVLAPCLAQDDSGSDRPTQNLEDEALRSLLGESDKPAEAPEPARPAREATTRPAPRETAREREQPRETEQADEPAREVTRSRPVERDAERDSRRSAPADTAVPTVPSDDGEDLSEDDRDLTADEEDAPEVDETTVPLSDYRPPTSSPGATYDDAAAPTEETPAEPSETEEPKGGSPASTIVISLIILAVLLVALAAIVGIMAAQRANRSMQHVPAAAPAAGHDVWAYLSAPGVPDIPVQQGSFVIGSDSSCDLRLADPKASPTHARIDETDNGWILTDLRSVNGTYLNGERIASPVSLQEGDQIQMGDIVVTFNLYE